MDSACSIINTTDLQQQQQKQLCWVKLWISVLQLLWSPGGGGGGVLPEKFGRGVRPASQNPYPIYDQNLWFSLPFLWPD